MPENLNELIDEAERLPELADELVHAIELERAWRRHMQRFPSLPSPSAEWLAAKKVGFAYKQVIDALSEYGHAGYDIPKQQGTPDDS